MLIQGTHNLAKSSPMLSSDHHCPHFEEDGTEYLRVSLTSQDVGRHRAVEVGFEPAVLSLEPTPVLLAAATALSAYLLSAGGLRLPRLWNCKSLCEAVGARCSGVINKPHNVE